MSEIKFRAWDNRIKSWAEDIKHELFFNLETKPNGKFYIHDQSETGKYNYTLEQFTGLKDKNGVEIFEGDIVHTYVHEDQEADNSIISDVIREHCGEWQVRSLGTDLCPQFEHGLPITWGGWDVEVIGNIHENPDLLEAK